MTFNFNIMYISKILLFILFMSIFFVMRKVIDFIWCFYTSKKYVISNKDKMLFYAALSYILTIIFKGL